MISKTAARKKRNAGRANSKGSPIFEIQAVKDYVNLKPNNHKGCLQFCTKEEEFNNIDSLMMYKENVCSPAKNKKGATCTPDLDPVAGLRALLSMDRDWSKLAQGRRDSFMDDFSHTPSADGSTVSCENDGYLTHFGGGLDMEVFCEFPPAKKIEQVVKVTSESKNPWEVKCPYGYALTGLKDIRNEDSLRPNAAYCRPLPGLSTGQCKMIKEDTRWKSAEEIEREKRKGEEEDAKKSKKEKRKEKRSLKKADEGKKKKAARKDKKKARKSKRQNKRNARKNKRQNKRKARKNKRQNKKKARKSKRKKRRGRRRRGLLALEENVEEGNFEGAASELNGEEDEEEEEEEYEDEDEEEEDEEDLSLLSEASESETKLQQKQSVAVNETEHKGFIRWFQAPQEPATFWKEFQDFKTRRTELTSIPLGCPPGMVMTSLSIENTTDCDAEKKGTVKSYPVKLCTVKVQALCCEVARLGGMTLLDNIRKTNEDDGGYCPTHFDDLRRPVFKQVTNFGKKKTRNTNVLSFKADTLQWCRGNDCSKENDEAVNPLQVDWTSDTSASFSVIGFPDMKGTGVDFSDQANAGNMGPGMREKIQKPALLKFEAIQPNYNAGCLEIEKDDPDFSSVSDSFSGSSPCGLTAARSWTAQTKLGDKKEHGPGMTYKQLDECSDRANQRALNAQHFHTAVDSVKEVLGVASAATSFACSTVPTFGSWAGFGGGVYMGIETSKICGDAGEFAFSVADSALAFTEIIQASHDGDWDNADCDPLQNSMMRILCDIHCVSDAVKAGTKAVIGNIEQLANVLNTNMDLLMEYYSKVVMQKVEVEVSKAIPAKENSMLIEKQAQEHIDSLTESINNHLRPKQPFDLDLSEDLQNAAKSAHQSLINLRSKIEHGDVTQNVTQKGRALVNGLGSISETFKKAGQLVENKQSFRNKMEGTSDAKKAQIVKPAQIIKDKITQTTIPKMKRRVKLHEWLHRAQRATTTALLERTHFLRDVAAVRRGNSQASEGGILNMKLDAILRNQQSQTKMAEFKDLQQTMEQLGTHWTDMHEHVNDYLHDADKLLAASNDAIADTESFLGCEAETAAGPSFISTSTEAVNRAATNAAVKLRKVWRNAVHTFKAHEQLLDEKRPLMQMIATSALQLDMIQSQSQEEQNDHKSDQSKKVDGRYWLSEAGVKDVYAALTKKVDEVPLNLAQNVLSMHHQLSFLQERMTRDGGEPMDADETRWLKEQHNKMTSQFDEELKLLDDNDDKADGAPDFHKKGSAKHGNRAALELLQVAVDSTLMRSSIPPTMCKMLIFQKFKDAGTEQMVMLANNTNNNNNKDSKEDYLLSPPIGSLLTHPNKDSFRFTLSKNMEKEQVPDWIPVSLLDGVYRCQRNSGKWSVHKALEASPKAKAAAAAAAAATVTFCGGSKCQGGEDLVVANLASLKGKRLGNTLLLNLWNKLKRKKV